MRHAIIAALVFATGPAIAQNSTAPAPAPATSTDHAGARKQMMQVCRADRETLCKGVEVGGGRVLQCFRANAAKLSAPCADALKSMRQRAD